MTIGVSSTVQFGSRTVRVASRRGHSAPGATGSESESRGRTRPPAANDRRINGGFSLVEVLCAILILGIGLVGLTQGITSALSASKESEQQTVAALFASGRIEMLRADGFLVSGLETGECGPRLPAYRWSQRVEETEIDGLFEVTVSVTLSRTGKLVYELDTMLFDPPFYSEDESTGSDDREGTGSRDRRQFD